MPVPLALSEKARRTRPQPISELIAIALGHPHLVNFAAGLVDQASLPVDATRRIVDRLLSDPVRGRAALQYDTTRGATDLRLAVLDHLAALDGRTPRELGLVPEDVIVTTGSQQSLYLIGDVLIDPGDYVIAANPSYFVYTGTLQSLGATVLPVPMDDDGMDVDAVDAVLARLDRDGQLHRLKLIYCTSYFDNPTGLTLSRARRKQLYDLAVRYSRRHRILILEDAAYRELRYDDGNGPALPSIKSLDPRNEHTIIAQTFSKPFAPGLKLGYSAMPVDLARAVIEQKGNHDFGSANLTQHVAAAAMRDGSYAQQVRALCDVYRAKRDAMLAALDRFMPRAGGGVTWTRPGGGLYVWVTLPETIDTSRDAMFKQAIDAGVLYVPGDYCFQPDANGRVPTNHLRLCFGNVPLDRIEPGIRALAGVVDAALRDGDRPESAGRLVATAVPVAFRQGVPPGRRPLQGAFRPDETGPDRPNVPPHERTGDSRVVPTGGIRGTNVGTDAVPGGAIE